MDAQSGQAGCGGGHGIYPRKYAFLAGKLTFAVSLPAKVQVGDELSAIVFGHFPQREHMQHAATGRFLGEVRH